MGSKANACAPLKWKKAERLQSWGHRRGRAVVWRCPWLCRLCWLCWLCWGWWNTMWQHPAAPLTCTHTTQPGSPTLSPFPLLFFVFLFLFFWGPRTHALDTWRYRRFRCVRLHRPNPQNTHIHIHTHSHSHRHPLGPSRLVPCSDFFQAFWQAWLASPRRFQKLKAAQIQGCGTGCGADQNKNLKRNNFGVKIAENIDGEGYSNKSGIKED